MSQFVSSWHSSVRIFAPAVRVQCLLPFSVKDEGSVKLEESRRGE